MVVELALGTLASTAVRLVVEGAAKKTGEEGATAGIRILAWMRQKLTGRTKEALDDCTRDPSSDNQADLRKQLTRCLESDPGFAAELRSLTPSNATADQQQTMKQSGNANRGAQVRGNKNRVQVS
jgi:hypothetical protein